MVKTNGSRTENVSSSNDTLIGRSTQDTLYEKQISQRIGPLELRRKREHEDLVRLHSSPVAIKLPDGTWNILRWVPDNKHVRSWKEKNFGCNYARCFRYALGAQLLGLGAGSTLYWITGSLIAALTVMFVVFIGSSGFIVPLMEKLDRHPVPSFRKIQEERIEPINQVYMMYSFFVLAIICSVGLGLAMYLAR